MAKIATLNLTGNGRVSIKAKNGRVGVDAAYTIILYGNFGGGTITTQVSADGGSTFVNLIDDGVAVTFTAGAGDNFRINSDELDPVFLGFNLVGATTPNITIKVYNAK